MLEVSSALPELDYTCLRETQDADGFCLLLF